MALIVLPRVSPASVNTLPRRLAGWLAGWQTRSAAHPSPPPDRQRVKGQPFGLPLSWAQRGKRRKHLLSDVVVAG